MTSSHSNYTDVRGSNFHHIGRDQNNVHMDITVLNLAPEDVRRTARKRPHDSMEEDSPQTYCKKRKLSPNNPRSVIFQWPTGSAGEVADRLIVEIVQLLFDHGETRDHYRRLELELEPLRQTLLLTNLAIQMFECTPLGQNLGHYVLPEVEQICVGLKELYDRVDRYRRSLWPTSIRKLWRKVCWKGCEVDDRLVSLRVSQQLLSKFLMALNS